MNLWTYDNRSGYNFTHEEWELVRLGMKPVDGPVYQKKTCSRSDCPNRFHWVEIGEDSTP